MKTALVAVAVVALLAAGLYSHFSSPPLPSPPPQSMQPVVGAPTGSCVPPMLVVDITSGIMYYCGNDDLWHGVVLSFTSPNSTVSVGGSGLNFTLDTVINPTTNLGGNFNVSLGATALTVLSGILNTYLGTWKASHAITANNITCSAAALTVCSPNPKITFLDCGSSATCASPVTIGSCTATSANTVTNGTINNAAIASGDLVVGELTAGSCVGLTGMSSTLAY